MSHLATLSREPIRASTQAAFYLLFLSAPLLNIFRFDLLDGHFIIFGYEWMFGLESSQFECLDDSHIVRNIIVNFLLPLFILLALSGAIVWKYGRIYCGWLCPHFSVVETLNRLMLKYLGKITFWEHKEKQVAQTFYKKLLFLSICIFIASIWSFVLLGYAYPPRTLIMEIYQLKLPFGAMLFLLLMTLVLTIDFFFARHLFCQYGCSLGIMQSFVWMANSRSMVISFDKSQAHLCQSCDNACDKACPMRLPVRGIKRSKFSCTQCGICLNACDEAQAENPNGRIIHWVTQTQAIEVDRPAASFNIKRLKKSR